MPRPQPTKQMIRERALRRAIARASTDMDLHQDQDIATALGMSQSAYAKRKKDPYHSFGFDEASNLARKLRLTGEEVCAIIGVPYHTPEGGEMK